MLRTKAVISALIALSLLLSMLTGLALWIWPGGMVLGAPRWLLTGAHNWISLFFGAMCIVHFVLNFKIFRREMAAFRQKRSGQFRQKRSGL